MPTHPAAGPENKGRIWPWVLLALLLLAGIVCYFVLAPPLALVPDAS